jgi:hypothetical protein
MNENTKITLEILKKRVIDKKTCELLERTSQFSEHNKIVYRHRMSNPEFIRWNVLEITHNGNDKRQNEDMLNVARCWYECGVYTDEEWNTYFIPAINEMIEYNNSFVRWYPGFVIRNKTNGRLAIVQYDYALAFWGTNYESLDVCEIGEDGRVLGSWAWASYSSFELIDKEHTDENIAKIREYHIKHGHTPPYYLNQKLSIMLYGRNSTEPPTRN